MNNYCAECQSVCKTYEKQAVLSDISFNITTGQHTAILGASGCGKSTLLRLLAGLEPPSAGQILLQGEIVSKADEILMPPHLRGIAMVFQDLALWPNLSVIDNVLLGLSGTALSKEETHARAWESLALCAIDSLARRRPGAISGGQQQRVALARALAVQPELLLLDEPFSGLDLVIKTKLLEDIAKLAEERDLTVLLVTHDPLEADTLCKSLIVLVDGMIEETGSFNGLLQDPQSELLKVFRKHML